MARPRAREIGIVIGAMPTGPHNTITDVAGVRVGHTTLISGEGQLRPGHGPVRTGVTVILPHADNLFRAKVPAAVQTINGFGKPLGFEQVRELGMLESPIALTNTLNVGLVADALVQHAIQCNPDIGVTTTSVNVLVGETNDGFLNDLQGRHVQAAHVFAALESAASGPVAEGNVGAGTGTSCFGWKGGIGAASRVIPMEAGSYTVGALVQSNFGRAQDLIIAGGPVGRQLLPPQHQPPARDGGSIMIVLATDAPLDARQLGRIAQRAAAGLARVGSVYAHGSGDFVIAFSTAYHCLHDAPHHTMALNIAVDERVIDALFNAVAESVEEAILNSLCCAETMVGRDGHTRFGLPLDEVRHIIQRACR